MSIRILVVSLLICLSLGNASCVEREVAVAVRESVDGFIVQATIKPPVSLRTAWDVLVDFDHMAGILNNLTTSNVVSRNGNILIVKQEGVARFGIFSYPFTAEREIRMEPPRRILAKNLSGTLKRMQSEVQLIPTGPRGVRIEYRAEFAFDSIIAGLFGVSFLNHEVEEQFLSIVAEMKKREAQAVSDPLQPQQ
ncbi:MAG: SRPBCC family protein [Dechloromonas sp.]|nr:SRPBCC family protein [Dechloromonas sp.]